MGPPFDQMPLISFMSTSKGWHGECGLRGGYMEMINFDPDVKGTFLKDMATALCASVLGQAAMDAIVSCSNMKDMTL